MPQEDLSAVFNYLDANKDGFIDYNEFTALTEEKRRDIDPFEPSPTLPSQFSHEELDKLEVMSRASELYHGFKSH